MDTLKWTLHWNNTQVVYVKEPFNSAPLPPWILTITKHQYPYNHKYLSSTIENHMKNIYNTPNDQKILVKTNSTLKILKTWLKQPINIGQDEKIL